MVRIFTTSFIFNHQNYDAIVTMVVKDVKVNITVKVLDVALHQILPGGTLSFDSSSINDTMVAGNSLTHTLMKSISTAVERHLVS